MKKILSAFVAVLACCMLFGFEADAKTEITKDNFDYEWYLEQHPDVEAAIGTNRDAIWEFYVSTGEPVGWLGRVSADWYAENYFDAGQYAIDNPDVVQALGTDADMLWQHYINNGKAEGRRAPTYVPDVNAILKVYEIADQITNNAMSVNQKVIAIHDWVCANTTYDYAGYNTGNIPDSSYTLAGYFETGRSVCQGYTLAMEAFLDAAGIQNQVQTGDVNNGTSIGPHAWNTVCIDGQWLHVDCTWDDFDEYNCITHDCCLISAEKMNYIHNGCVMYFSYDGKPLGYRKR